MRGLAQHAKVDPSQVHRMLHGKTRRPRVLQQVLAAIDNKAYQKAMILAQILDEAERWGLDSSKDIVASLVSRGGNADGMEEANGIVREALKERLKSSLAQKAAKPRKRSIAKDTEGL